MDEFCYNQPEPAQQIEKPKFSQQEIPDTDNKRLSNALSLTSKGGYEAALEQLDIVLLSHIEPPVQLLLFRAFLLQKLERYDEAILY